MIGLLLTCLSNEFMQPIISTNCSSSHFFHLDLDYFITLHTV